MEGHASGSGVPQNFSFPPQSASSAPGAAGSGYQGSTGIPAASSRLYPSTETSQPGANSSGIGNTNTSGGRAGFAGSAGNDPQSFIHHQRQQSVPFASSFQGHPIGGTRSSSPPTVSGSGGAVMTEDRLRMLRQLRLQQQQQHYQHQLAQQQQQQQQMYSQALQPGMLAPGMMMMMHPNTMMVGGVGVEQQHQQLPPLPAASVHLKMMGRPPPPPVSGPQQAMAMGATAGGGRSDSPLASQPQQYQQRMLQQQQQQMQLQEEEESKKSRGNYLCSKCKVPKKGHVCPFQTRLIRRDQSKSEVSDAACQAELDEGMTLRALDWMMMQMGSNNELILQGSKGSFSPETYLLNPCFVLPPELRGGEALEGGNQNDSRRSDLMPMRQEQQQRGGAYPTADQRGFGTAADNTVISPRFSDTQLRGGGGAVAVAVGPAQVAFFPAAPSAEGASVV